MPLQQDGKLKQRKGAQALISLCVLLLPLCLVTLSSLQALLIGCSYLYLALPWVLPLGSALRSAELAASTWEGAVRPCHVSRSHGFWFCPHCGRGMWMQDGWGCALCQPWVCRAERGVAVAPSQQNTELWAFSSLFWESGAAWEVDPGRVQLSRTRAPQARRGARRSEEQGSCWGPSLRSPGSHAWCPEAVQSQQRRAFVSGRVPGCRQ